MKIGFIGLGLIGGSIAKSIRKKLPDTTIIAYDIDRNALELALSEGVINDICPFAGNSLDMNAFADCSVLFLCAPVHSNTEYLKDLSSVLSEDAVLTDVGSVKSEIHEIIEDAGLSKWFVGGHPMAGSEKSGYANSNDHLVENAYYILSPEKETDAAKTQTLSDLVTSIGAIPITLSPDKHDYATGAISHVPHVIAASLVNLVKNSDYEDGIMKLIAAGGFKDITRIASSSPEMWRQICLVNGDNINILLDKYIASLQDIRRIIEERDSESIFELFKEARDYRNSFVDASLGPIKKQFVLYCDIIDESGAIATISTILATQMINIKNIGIIHSREFVDGALRIEFESEHDVENAAQLLEKHRYIVYRRS